MPLPVGTVPIGGPLIDTTAADLAPSDALRDAGAISFRGGELRKVNADGDAWVGVPGHAVGATEPANPFDGQLWYDTANDSLKDYDGSAFVASGGGIAILTGSGAPAASLGISGNWYLRTSNGQWYEKVNTTWHGRYTPPQLSDVAPLATSTSADEGTGLASSREDHIHVGLALGSQQPEDTGNAADIGARGFASREDHVHAIGYGTGNVESVGHRQRRGNQRPPSAARSRARRRHSGRRA